MGRSCSIDLTTTGQWPHYALQHAAHAHRATLLGEWIGAALVAVAAALRRTRERIRAERQTRAAREAFARLDDHTLRDLGLHRSEFLDTSP